MEKLKNKYICFDEQLTTIYRVLDENKNYVLVEDSTGTYWEKKEYIVLILNNELLTFKLKEK